MENLNIAVVLGTAREGRLSERVARSVVEKLKEKGASQVDYVDVKDFLFGRTIPSWVESSEAEEWRGIAERADAFVLVVPEYNRSYPGELKILLDSAYKQYRKKAVTVVGVSSGGFAGARMYENIQHVLTELGMVISPKPILVSSVEGLFDEAGNLAEDRKEMFLKSVEDGLDSLSWYTKTLKSNR